LKRGHVTLTHRQQGHPTHFSLRKEKRLIILDLIKWERKDKPHAHETNVDKLRGQVSLMQWLKQQTGDGALSRRRELRLFVPFESK
jgi:hypothetical protein